MHTKQRAQPLGWTPETEREWTGMDWSGDGDDDDAAAPVLSQYDVAVNFSPVPVRLRLVPEL